MITLELDKPRHFCLGTNALCDAEKAADSGIIAMVNVDKIGLRSLRALLWAGLKEEDPNLTLEKTGVLMEAWREKGKTFGDLEKVVLRAMYESGWFPELAEFCKSLEENGTTTAGNGTR